MRVLNGRCFVSQGISEESKIFCKEYLIAPLYCAMNRVIYNSVKGNRSVRGYIPQSSGIFLLICAANGNYLAYYWNRVGA